MLYVVATVDKIKQCSKTSTMYLFDEKTIIKYDVLNCQKHNYYYKL